MMPTRFVLCMLLGAGLCACDLFGSSEDPEPSVVPDTSAQPDQDATIRPPTPDVPTELPTAETSDTAAETAPSPDGSDTVEDTGPPPECTEENAATACDDDDDCTEDSCVDSVCTHAPIAGCCTEDAQCDDGIACTVDSCNTFQDRCLNLPESNLCCVAPDDCDDGDACTVDLCAANTCVHLQDPTEAGCTCSSAFGCNDGTDCTTDSCSDGVCTNTPIPSQSGCCLVAADCDDGVATTFDDCQQGMCWNVALPCATDDDCGSIDACLVGRCEAGLCTFDPAPWEGCCQVSTECDDGLVATADACVNNQCVHSLGTDPPKACSDDGACSGTTGCAVETCATQAGLCSTAAAQGAGCCQVASDCPTPADFCQAASCEAFTCGASPLTALQPWWTDTFDNLDGWTADGDGKAAKWQLGTAQAISTPSSLYYGDIAAMNYNVGATSGTVATDLITPPPDASQLQLRFWVSADIEPISSRDLLWAEVVIDGVATEVWNKEANGGLGTGWSEQTVDLATTVSGPFQLRFAFDSVDGTGNAGAGVYIDDVRLLALCP